MSEYDMWDKSMFIKGIYAPYIYIWEWFLIII
jgi:hypothetical protein